MNPHVITLHELTARLTEDIKSTGITVIRESTKKHIRRTIETEFAESVQFCNDEKGKTLIFPISLTIHELAKENHKLKKELQNLTSTSSEDFSIITKAGHIIRTSIKEIHEPQAWPFTPALVDWDNFRIPELLRTFLTCVLSGEPYSNSLSQRIHQLVHSYGQDLVYSVTCGRVKPPKHILLPNAVKTLTGNTKLMQIILYLFLIVSNHMCFPSLFGIT